jgi:hypothetical protein
VAAAIESAAGTVMVGLRRDGAQVYIRLGGSVPLSLTAWGRRFTPTLRKWEALS